MSRTTFPPLEDDFSRALLRSAEGDEPSNAAYAKAATALGVGAGLGVGASLAAPSMVAAGAAGVGRWSGLTAARLWALGISGALLVGGGALLLHARLAGGAAPSAAHGTASRPLRAPKEPALSAPSLKQVTASLAPRSDAPKESALSPQAAGQAVAAQAAPVVTPTHDAPAAITPVAVAKPLGPRASVSGPHRALSAAQTASGSSLPEQVQSLDRARVALGSGDAGTALQEIAHYRKAWPRGVFLTEASVLEIEALAARGERSSAAARAAAFVAAHPDSPQAERLRRLIPPEKR